jgi:hypothetical protein
MLSTHIDHQLVDLYRGWDALEKQQHNNSVLDFDLAPPRNFPMLRDRREVLDCLNQMISALSTETTSLVTLARARLQASQTYLRSLLGEKIDFETYIEQTLCLKPERFTEELIDEQKYRVERELRNKLHRRFRAKEAHLFESDLFVKDTTILPKQFEHFSSVWLPELLEHIPVLLKGYENLYSRWLPELIESVPLKEYNVRVEFAREDAYWKNWISGNLSDHEILLRINIHPRQTWYQGFSEILVIHEYCGHAVQMINWHRQIESGQLPQFMGILTVHFPDQFLLEGLAECLSHFLPGESRHLEDRSIVLRELHRYNLLVLNNVHVIANIDGPDAAFVYGIDRLPFTREKVLKKEIKDRTQNPLFRGYQYVYGIAKERFLKVLSHLERTEAWNMLRFIYDTPMTAKQFQDSINQFKPSRGRREIRFKESKHF